MMALIVQIIIALIVAGFIFWAGRKIIAVLPLDAIFVQVIEVLLLILAAAVIIFYAVLPVLHAIAGISINIH